MKLRNKKTGVIVDLVQGYIKDSYYGQKIEIKPVAISNKEGYIYDSLAELNSEWEDYEEPKEYWFIDEFGLVQKEIEYYYEENKEAVHDKRIAVGNYFESKEEAEKAVEKLKAWKRLKDKGFSIYSWDYEFVMVDKPSQTIILRASAVDTSNTDLDLLFSGEDD